MVLQDALELQQSLQGREIRLRDFLCLTLFRLEPTLLV